MTRWHSDVDVVGVHRRIHGMMAQGHSGALIARAAGMGSHQWVFEILDSQSVRLRTADKVRWVASRLSGVEGPSTASRNHAARNGWPPLHAWLPGAIDNPQARPLPWRDVDRVAVERAIQAARTGQRRSVKLSKDEARIVVARLASAPYLMHDNAIALGMGKAQSWVTATRDRVGVPRVVVRAAPGRRAA